MNYTGSYLEEFIPAALLTMNEVLWVIAQSGGAAHSVRGERYVGPLSTITLAHTPINGVAAYRGGGRQDPGGGSPDYTLSGAVVTPISALLTGEVMIFDYNW